MVKRILVEEKELVMGEIESFLCRQGISYVKVENEIHIPNLILRFFDFEEYRLICRVGLENIIENFSLDDLLLVNSNKVLLPRYQEFLSDLKSKRPQREFIIPITTDTKKVKPTPYPPFRYNKRKKLQIENGKIMKKIKK